MAGISGFATGVNLTEGAGAAIELTGGTNIAVSPDPITGTGTISVDVTASNDHLVMSDGNGGLQDSFIFQDGSTWAFDESCVRTGVFTVATLPAASDAGMAARAFVTDANATIIVGLGLTVVGGGANKVPVYSDGTNWIVG